MKPDDDDITFRLPARPPAALWLAVLALALYTGITYALDPQVWTIFRILVPLFMAYTALGAVQILASRWHERQRRRELAGPTPNASPSLAVGYRDDGTYAHDIATSLA
ncbi:MULTISPECIES: hypothetical protein [Tsukamurella]|uniref:hypothetical protein n=1 Tax=Tsukamurella TaxID=2060 RepID=UPI002DD43523|nr:hypothetical protein [Tsukamurella tyrosinosolvens]MEC4616448.1 hypothetical protein [Tsukamurella tyrosinosolvens]